MSLSIERDYGNYMPRVYRHYAASMENVADISDLKIPPKEKQNL